MKKSLFYILDFLSYSNIFVALCAFVFSKQAIFLFGEDFSGKMINYYPVLFSLSVFFIYGLQRMFQVLKMMRNPQIPNSISVRDFWILKNIKLLIGLLSLTSAAIIFLVFWIDWKLIFYFSPLLLMSILYFIGPLPLKTLPGMKSFIISFVWVAAAYIVPCYLGNKTMDFHSWMYIAGQFFLLNALCIPFDIRDYGTDKIKPQARVEPVVSNLLDEDYAERKQVRSLPVVLGIRGSKVIAAGMVLIYVFFCGSEHFLYHSSDPRFLLYTSLLTSFYALIIILISKEKRSNYFFAFFADGGLIVQSMALFFCFEMYFATR